MVTEDFEDGKSSSTLLVYFSAIWGLSKEEGNEYLRPARSALRQSEGSVYHFYWSENGQTISWDRDTHLSMGQFRRLAHEAFHQAMVQSRRLMYDFEPEDPKIGSLRDQLSKTTPGYSFLTDPQNKLEELYLTVFMRACIAPVDGLLKSQNHDGQSGWDTVAAQAYLHGHDALLKILMVLGQLDSGQCARVSELLTLEDTNTRSRLRGIGIFGGQMFSITHHNKAHLTTNPYAILR
ncbi:hypothetical protein FACUT_10201 [Fusarium acutatum]|uniref:Uncharacterized protein n=1 Tax=Fusarium acutatum TaxID=78861 RepID=A0A8H4JHF5_9HYPO|nr:hypothetical protein FACUT_10201 [Fusarium acutatum]